MGSGFDEGFYWHYFTARVNYTSSYVELLVMNLSEEALTGLYSLEFSNPLLFLAARQP